MKLGQTLVIDTFAEAFGMRYTRLVVTAHDEHWLEMATREFTGCATSIIGCDAEAGVDERLAADTTPDGRPGAAVLVFGHSKDALAEAVQRRVGQCLLTCPTTALYDGLPDSDERLALGKHVRYFGDGFQQSKVIDGVRYWRMPVMDGEFLIQESAGVAKGVAGGCLLIETTNLDIGLAAARRAADAVAAMPGVIAPFPGGVVRSGSKVGSRYKALRASTNEVFCPTLRGRVESQLQPETGCVYEIVIDGIDETTVGAAMASAARSAAGEGVIAIGSANYGGDLGKYHLKLWDLLA